MLPIVAAWWQLYGLFDDFANRLDIRLESTLVIRLRHLAKEDSICEKSFGGLEVR